MSEEGYVLVGMDELHAFVVRCMAACNVSKQHAVALAGALVAADYWGHNSHGTMRIGNYVNAVRQKCVALEGGPSILKETVATALVDGHNVLGPVTAQYCMDLAIEKAKKAGIGWVSARGCNHFGIAGRYGQRALQHGFLAMIFTNATPNMAPTRAKKAVLGTNPICVAAPAKDGDRFLLDMATTVVASGKVDVAGDKGQDVPHGWIMDQESKSVTDPKQMKSMFPLGGEEITSGYKGYGLSMMVEVLTGMLAGSNYGVNIPINMTEGCEANREQCFVAINPKVFEEGFTDRMSDLISSCRNADLADGESEILIPGDPEKKHMKKCDEQGGIYFHPNQIHAANTLAVSLNVETLKTL